MRRIRSLAVLLAAFALSAAAHAYTEDQLEAAHLLYDLGMMKGSAAAFSAESMALDSQTTRAELAVTITRLLGKEEKAKYQRNPHPFSDVPDWAGDYVGYLYENYLVNGTSDTTFGSDEPATVRQFCTMLLRVLGYDDAAGDFSYEGAPYTAVECGLIDGRVAECDLLCRGDMMTACVNALRSPIFRSDKPLAKKLYDARVIDSSALALLGNTERDVLEKQYGDLPASLGMPRCFRDTAGRVLILPATRISDYGIRLFCVSDRHPVPYELPRRAMSPDGISFEPGKITYNGATGSVGSLTVYGGDTEPNARLIIVMCSSEGASYQALSRSEVFTLPTSVNAAGYDGLGEAYGDVAQTLPSVSVKKERNGSITLTFARPVDHYGLHILYTSEAEPTPAEIWQSGAICFVKGEKSYRSGDPREYISTLTVYGLPEDEATRLLILSCSSESSAYNIYGRSAYLAVTP